MSSLLQRPTAPRVTPSLIGVLAMVLMICGWTLPVVAQTPFSLANIGQRITTDDARMVGRGGWGMAVADSLNPGTKNLASLSSLRHLMLKFTVYGDQITSQDTRGERKNSRVIAPDIRVAAPVIKGRLALTAGLMVYRSMQYHTLIDTTWGLVWGDSISGTDHYSRTGNRFRVPLGGAFEVFPWLSLGGSVNIEGGSLKATASNFFTQPSTSGGPLYQTNVKETYDEYHGTSQTWGVLLAPLAWFQAGASWTPAHKVEANRDVVHFGVSQHYLTSFTMQMPDEYMAGIQIKPFNRWRLGGDGQFQGFSEFTGPGEYMGDMEDEYTLSVGLERMKGRVRRGGWSNLPIRVGASVRRWAYRVGGNPVDQKTISIGTGFPFRRDLGELDIAISYGQIGELEKNGLESKLWRLTVSVTGLERWW